MKKINNYHIELNSASKFLGEGQIIAIPTDTYYGLACDPFNFEALNKLFELKEREVTQAIAFIDFI